MMINRPYRNLDAGGFLFICFFLLTLSALRSGSSPPVMKAKTEETPKEGLYIQISGDVAFAGTYFFDHPPGPREIFPGLKIVSSEHNPFRYKKEPFVSHSLIKIRKTDKTCVISRKEIPAHQKLTLGIPLSLNEETEEGLTAIPGIGPQTAKALVTEREKRGGFKNMDEIKSVKGIGKGIFQKIKPFLNL